MLKDVYFRIERLIKAELNDEPYTKELSACVKLQLLRKSQVLHQDTVDR